MKRFSALSSLIARGELKLLCFNRDVSKLSLGGVSVIPVASQRHRLLTSRARNLHDDGRESAKLATVLFGSALCGAALLVRLRSDPALTDSDLKRVPSHPAAGHLDVLFCPRDKLGRGSFGTVYRAVEREKGPVALKIIRRNEESMRQEVEALKRVREAGGHPHIAEMYGVVSLGPDSENIGLVFELLAGGELYENLVECGAFSESRAADIVKQVATALAFLHETVSIAHGDLKPENLLLRSKTDDLSDVALCDFGSSINLTSLLRAPSPQRVARFRGPSRCRNLGTVAYAAPELLREELTDITAAVDIWSLGCILFVILSGQHPFDPDNELNTDEELAPRVMNGIFYFDAPVWKDISPDAKHLIQRMLHPDPIKRLTAREVLAHEWLTSAQTQLLEGSDVRLRGYLRTQRRLQDQVFAMIVEGSLERAREEEEAAQRLLKQPQDEDVEEEVNPPATPPAPNGKPLRFLDEVYGSIDVQHKGFISSDDLDRAINLAKKSSLRAKNAAAEQAALASVPAEISRPDEVSEEDRVFYGSLNGLVGMGERVSMSPGQIVFRRGDEPDFFYFVDSGRCEVLIQEDLSAALQRQQSSDAAPGAASVDAQAKPPPDDTAAKKEVKPPRKRRTTATIAAGDFFGEGGLVNNRPRNATVRAGPTGAEIIRFSKADFDALTKRDPTVSRALAQRIKERSVEHIKHVYTTLFRDTETVHVGQGSYLLRRGEPSRDMYFIVSGVVDVIDADGNILARRRAGETVGELGLVSGAPRSSDVRCSSVNGCAFKRLDKEDLDRVVRLSPEADSQVRSAMSVSRESGLSRGVKIRIASADDEEESGDFDEAFTGVARMTNESVITPAHFQRRKSQ